MERVENLLKISIHAPREGSDTRRARHTPGWTHFYPRSPRGGRHSDTLEHACSCCISIHAPREGSDLCLPLVCR